MIITNAQYNRTCGLGNKLFSWSRAKILSQEKAYYMPKQIWFSPRGAAIIRGGIEYRNLLGKIWLLDNFINGNDDISFFKYIYLKKTFVKFYVRDLIEARNIINENSIIIFKWYELHNFKDLWNKQKIILKNLTQITKQKHLRYLRQFDSTEFIGLNIRLGNDFQTAGVNVTKSYIKTDLNWFINALETVRAGNNILPAYIISDGSEKELKPILDLPKTYLFRSHAAIVDLLMLSKAKIILGSGNSTFSAWGSFLSGSPTYSSPNTPFTKFFISNEQKQIISVI